MEIPFALFSFSGLISRESYLWGKLGNLFINYLLYRILVMALGSYSEWNTLHPFFLFILTIGLIFNVWSHLAMDMKRLRDGGYSNYWLFLNAVPFAQILLWAFLLIIPSEDGRILTHEEETKLAKELKEEKTYAGLLERAQKEPRNLAIWQLAYQETLLHHDYANALRLAPHLLELEIKQGYAIEAFSHWIFLKKHQQEVKTSQSVDLLCLLGSESNWAEAGAILKTLLQDNLTLESWRALIPMRISPLQTVLANMARAKLEQDGLSHEMRLVLMGFIGSAQATVETSTQVEVQAPQAQPAAETADDDWTEHSQFHQQHHDALRIKLAEPLGLKQQSIDLRLHDGQLRTLPYSLIAAMATGFVRPSSQEPYCVLDLRLKADAIAEFGDILRLHSRKNPLPEPATTGKDPREQYALLIQRLVQVAPVPVLPMGAPIDAEDFEPFASEAEFEKAVYGKVLAS